MKAIPNDPVAKKRAEKARYWIKSWFFVVEDENEFQLSYRRFYEFLDENKKILSTAGVEAIKQYIVTKLLDLKPSWVNYMRLHTLGMDTRTTSIGEAMHYSMKSGETGVKPHMSLDKSANTMMDKAEKKGCRKQPKMQGRRHPLDCGLSQILVGI